MLRSALLRSRHAFTGVAQGSFVGASRASSEEQLRLALDASRFCTISQIHSADLHFAEDLPGRSGVEGDALATAEPGLAVAVRVADCVPVLVEGEGFVGAIHAGWRGTAGDIVRKSIATMEARWGRRVLRAAVGPAIGGSCYEVSLEVVEALEGVAPPGLQWREGRNVDLVALNLGILRSLGIEAEAVGPCTRCAPAYWSHRRDGAAAGRQVGAICL
ncbi:MAG TPA: polyphenol oxidase family protein [Myxococcota bacterium]|nr:polyphenol oxidase family protein [Myxococcota bacterium]